MSTLTPPLCIHFRYLSCLKRTSSLLQPVQSLYSVPFPEAKIDCKVNSMKFLEIIIYPATKTENTKDRQRCNKPTTGDPRLLRRIFLRLVTFNNARESSKPQFPLEMISLCGKMSSHMASNFEARSFCINSLNGTATTAFFSIVIC